MKFKEPYQKVIFGMLLLCMLLLMTGYIAAGWYSRYMADDYCYDAEFIQHGFFQGQLDSYLHYKSFSSNRYSLTLFSGISWLLGGVRTAPVLPGLSIVLWWLALTYTIRMAASASRTAISYVTSAFNAATILFYTFLLAPNFYEVIYWRSGMLPYFMPLIFLTFLAGRFIHYSLSFSTENKNLSAAGWLELSLLTWIAAGFSETIFALQAAVWGFAFLFLLLFRKKNGFLPALAVLAGTLAGGVLLAASPTIAIRQSFYPPPPPIPVLLVTSLAYTRDFLYTSVRATPLPFFFVVCAGFLVGLWHFPSASFRWKSLLACAAASLFGLGIMTLSLVVPTVWSMSFYPSPRSFFAGNFLLSIFFAWIGFWCGGAFKDITQKKQLSRWIPLVSIVTAVMVGVYALHFLPATYAKVQQYQLRAEAWDARNANITQLLSEGKTSIVVKGLDSIAKIYELQPNAEHWVNQCAAWYYGLQAIATDE